jgi:hypothetical protein
MPQRDHKLAPADRFCIGLPARGDDRLQLGDMLSETVRQMGFVPELVRDGEPRALDSKLLLLVGDCHGFERFASLLTRHHHRPRTILWQIDPLPPPQLDTELESIGCEALHRLDRREQSWWWRLLKNTLPRPARRSLRLTLYRKTLGSFTSELARLLPAPYNRLDELSCRFLLRGYLWLKQQWPRGWLDHIFCTSPAATSFLVARNLPARSVPFGWHPLMGQDLHLTRDLDVVFIGNTKSPRRQATLQYLTQALDHRQIKLHLAPDNCFAAARTELLSRARISVNIAQYPWHVNGLRFLMSMACGCLVISEPAADNGPYRNGVHFVHADIPQLPDVIAYYLQHHYERRQIVDSARSLITGKLSLSNCLSEILELSNANTTVQTPGL